MPVQFFVTDGHVSPTNPTVRFFTVRERARVRLLGPVYKVLMHWVDGRTIPHLLNGQCKHCDRPMRWTGHAPVSMVSRDRGNEVEQVILTIPEGSLGHFTKDLIGQVLTLNRIQEGRISRLVIEKREPSELPLPKHFDMISTLNAWWRGATIDFSTAHNLAAAESPDAPQLRAS